MSLLSWIPPLCSLIYPPHSILSHQISRWNIFENLFQTKTINTNNIKNFFFEYLSQVDEFLYHFITCPLTNFRHSRNPPTTFIYSAFYLAKYQLIQKCTDIQKYSHNDILGYFLVFEFWKGWGNIVRIIPSIFIRRRNCYEILLQYFLGKDVKQIIKF